MRKNVKILFVNFSSTVPTTNDDIFYEATFLILMRLSLRQRVPAQKYGNTCFFVQASDCVINYFNDNKFLLPYLQPVKLFLHIKK